MELKVYRQATYERKDGTIIYRGEDALPYVDDKMFMVADGLGGAASIRHTKVDRGLYDADAIMNTLFHDVFDEECTDPRFISYVKESFQEIIGNEDIYFESVSDIKKSGYYASRIITALFLHIILSDWKNVDFEKGFDEFFDQYGEKEQKKRLEALAESVRNKLRGPLLQVAKNANLFYESGIERLTLLGTTLCATVYSQDENTVHAAYFTAGDSRPYVWTMEDGLAQLLRDQEQPDGGMTNCICANEDKSFDIQVNYFTFPKKCILFNATDGCFDSRAFVSQMAFEKLILDSITQSSSLAEVEQKLTEFFLIAGKHDDSSTIAMQIFGYNSFEELQEACSKRLQILTELYFSTMEDLLAEDFQVKYQKVAKVDPEKLQEVKEQFGETIEVKELCRSQISSEKYPPYMEAMSAISEENKSLRQGILDATTKIEEVVRDNYLKYFMAAGNELSRWDRSADKLQDDEEDYEQAAEKYLKDLEKHKKNFDEALEQIRVAIEGLYSIGIPESHEVYEVIDFSILDDCETKMGDLFKYFEEIKKNKYEINKRIFNARRKYIERNRKLANQNEEFILQMVNKIIAEGIQDDVELLPQETYRLQSAIAVIEAAKDDIQNLESKREKAAEVAAEQYWNQYYETMIRALISDDRIQFTPDLLTKAKDLFGEMDSEVLELKEKADRQKMLLEQYQVGYSKYLEAIEE